MLFFSARKARTKPKPTLRAAHVEIYDITRTRSTNTALHHFNSNQKIKYNTLEQIRFFFFSHHYAIIATCRCKQTGQVSRVHMHTHSIICSPREYAAMALMKSCSSRFISTT